MKLFLAAWTFVLASAAFDAHFAVAHRATFAEWELNPLARTLGLSWVLPLKAAGLAFALAVAVGLRGSRPADSALVTAVATALHAVLLVFYLLA